MSADNGYIIRQNKDGKFVLQMYFMSDDEYPPIENAHPSRVFDLLEEAEDEYDRMEDEVGYLCEYGLTIAVPLEDSLALSENKISITRDTAEACLRLVEQYPLLRGLSVHTELRKALGLEEA